MSVLTTLTAAPAEVTAAAEIIEKMKGSLSSLGVRVPRPLSPTAASIALILLQYDRKLWTP